MVVGKTVTELASVVWRSAQCCIHDGDALAALQEGLRQGHLGGGGLLSVGANGAAHRQSRQRLCLVRVPPGLAAESLLYSKRMQRRGTERHGADRAGRTADGCSYPSGRIAACLTAVPDGVYSQFYHDSDSNIMLLSLKPTLTGLGFWTSTIPRYRILSSPLSSAVYPEGPLGSNNTIRLDVWVG